MNHTKLKYPGKFKMRSVTCTKVMAAAANTFGVPPLTLAR